MKCSAVICSSLTEEIVAFSGEWLWDLNCFLEIDWNRLGNRLKTIACTGK